MSQTRISVFTAFTITASFVAAPAVPTAAQVTGALPPAAAAAPSQPAPPPMLKSNVTVTNDIVRLGDLIEGAGAFAAIPVFRSPDVGTTGSVAARKVIEAARAHNLLGVMAGDVVDVEVSRTGLAIGRKDIEARIARLFAGTNGLGKAVDLAINFDREPLSFEADLMPGADLRAMRAALDPRSGRFDVLFEVPLGDQRRTLVHYTGTVIETADALVPIRTIRRGEIVGAADLSVERRPKAAVLAGDVAATPDDVVGRVARQVLPEGQPMRRADLTKPEIVRRDDGVTLIYEAPGLQLTARGKALQAGGEGDLINVLNLQSQRPVQGVITGPGRVDISPPTLPSANNSTSPLPADVPAAGRE
jgi:flagellar basal body P-ring formation protein FlgA